MIRKLWSPKLIAEAIEDEDEVEVKPAKKSDVKHLAQCMANSYVLSQRAWSFHWNYEGASFAELHEVFGKIYDRLNEEVDEIAERIRALKQTPPSSLSEVLENCTVDDKVASKTESSKMVRLLEKGLVEHKKCFDDALKVAQKAKDDASIELLSRRLGELEKDIWMLNSTK